MFIRHFPSRASSRALSRILAMALLGFQALLWGGGSTIEARTAAESLMRVSHVEDQSTTDCPPFHGHLECLICRTLSGGAGGESAPVLLPVALGQADQPAACVTQALNH